MSPKTTPSAPSVSAAAPPAWTAGRAWPCPSPGVCSGVGLGVVVIAVVVVERLARELAADGIEDGDVEGVAAVVVRGEEGEAVLVQDAVVDGQAGGLCGRDRGPVHDGRAPDERHRGDRAVLAAPA